MFVRIGGAGLLRRSRKFFAIRVSTRAKGVLPAGRQTWVSISGGYVYLSHARGRAYWLLDRIEKGKRPKITFNAGNQTLTINTFTVQFLRRPDFTFAYQSLAPFATQPRR